MEEGEYGRVGNSFCPRYANISASIDTLRLPSYYVTPRKNVPSHLSLSLRPGVKINNVHASSKSTTPGILLVPRIGPSPVLVARFQVYFVHRAAKSRLLVGLFDQYFSYTRAKRFHFGVEKRDEKRVRVSFSTVGKGGKDLSHCSRYNFGKRDDSRSSRRRKRQR